MLRAAPALAVALVVSGFSLSAPAQGVETVCHGLTVTIPGTDAADDIHGTPEADVIAGGPGADVIRGGDGDDVICGNGDDDELHGGPGHDFVIGGDDRRGEEWGESHFFYYGDTLTGGLGDDTLIADGDEVVTDHPKGRDTVSYEGSARPMSVRLDLGTAVGQGHDVLEDANTVVLSPRDDEAVAGRENAQILGGRGDDVIGTAVGFAPPYRRTDALIDGFLDGGPGRDELTTWGPYWELFGRGAGDRLTAREGAFLVGGRGRDWIVGSESGDEVVSWRGVDHVFTRGGPDRLEVGVAQKQVDVLHANLGEGADKVAVMVAPRDGTTFDLGPGPDRVGWFPHAFESQRSPLPDVTFRAGRGRDVLAAPVMIDDGTSGPPKGMWADLEAGTIRTLTTTAEMTVRGFEGLVGSPWRDILFGSAGPNVIRGGDRDDEIWGRAGNDVLLGNGGWDHARGGRGRDSCDAERTTSCA